MIFPLVNDKPKNYWGQPSGYCGPRAIAHLTGVPLSRAEHMIRRIRHGYRDRNGRRLPVKGTYKWEVKKVLERLGCKVTKVNFIWLSLGEFLEDTKHLDHTYLVNVTGHYTVAHKGIQTDTNLRPKRRVKNVWIVEAPTVPRYRVDDPIGRKPRPSKPKPDIQSVYQRTLAKIKVWQAKVKRGQTALRKLNTTRKYYERLLSSRNTQAASAAPLPPPSSAPLEAEAPSPSAPAQAASTG